MNTQAIQVLSLGCATDEDYPRIDWSRHRATTDRWLEVDELVRGGTPLADELTRDLSYRVSPSKIHPKVDCLNMVPGHAISARTRDPFLSLGISGLVFMPFRVNDEPWYRPICYGGNRQWSDTVCNDQRPQSDAVCRRVHCLQHVVTNTGAGLKGDHERYSWSSGLS
jgi:hypothetical protein